MILIQCNPSPPPPPPICKFIVLTLLSLNRGKKKKIIPAVDHANIAYEPFRKDFYVEVQDIGKMTEEEVKNYRQNDLKGVKVRGKHCPRPIKAFTQCGLSERIMEIMRRNSYLFTLP